MELWLELANREQMVLLQHGRTVSYTHLDVYKRQAFRADIDALPTEDGAQHLCGHDGHMSILLGFLEYIMDNKESLNDNIVFVFQPAEEDTGGAERLMKAGVFKKYNVDEVYGLHIHPDFPEGYIGCKAGYLMAQNGEIDRCV